MVGEFEPEQIRLEWVEEFRSKFSGGIAHTFILHGAVNDYVCEEPVKLDSYLAQLLSKTRQLVCFYNCSRGITFASPKMRKKFLEAVGHDVSPQPAPELLFQDPYHALINLEKAMLAPDLKGQVAVIIEYPELIWPDSDYSHLTERDRFALATLRRWASGDEFIAAAQVILLLTSTPGNLHPDLRAASSMIESIEIPYPNTEERERFIERRLADRNVELAEGLTPRSFAALTGGLTRQMVDDICLRAVIEQRPVDVSLIKDRKDQIIRQEYGEVIEILEPRIGFDKVGGMEEVKNYLRRSVIAPLQGKAPISRMPAGVLLAGPPGTGKTLLVSALAHEAGVNVVKLNVGRLLGQYVGNSERNLEKALACIRSLIPVIVMIDEIEQQFQRGTSSDGGVERRIFGRILEEMSGASGTRRGEVVWFAATNRVDLVDPALCRPGRFDRIVPILPPNDRERWSILCTKLPRQTQISQQEAQQIVAASRSYTGADMDGVMIKAAELALDEGHEHPQGRHIIQALQCLRPSHSSAEVGKMIDAALAHCNDLSLVPEEWRQRVFQHFPAQAQPTAPRQPDK